MRRQGFFWWKNWGFFVVPDRYAKKLLDTLGQDDKVLSDEVVRVLRRERLRVAALYLTWWVRYGWGQFRRRLAKWKAMIKQELPLQQEPTLVEVIGKKLAEDPEAAGFTKQGVAGLTEGKKGCSE